MLPAPRLNHSDGLSRSLEGISGNNQGQIPVGSSGFPFTPTSGPRPPRLKTRDGKRGPLESDGNSPRRKSTEVKSPCRTGAVFRHRERKSGLGSRQGSNGEAYARGNSSRSLGILNLSARPMQLPDFLPRPPSHPLQAPLFKPLLPPPLRAARTGTRGGPELASTLLGPVEAA